MNIRNYLPIEMYRYQLAFREQFFINLIVQVYMVYMSNKFIRVCIRLKRKKEFKKYMINIINLLLISQSPILGLAAFIFQQKKQKNNILLSGLFMTTTTDLEGNIKRTYHVKQIIVGILLPAVVATVFFVLSSPTEKRTVISPVLRPLPRAFEIACGNVDSFNKLLIHTLNNHQGYYVNSIRYQGFVIKLAMQSIFDIQSHSEQILEFIRQSQDGELCLYRVALLDYLIDKTCQNNPILDKLCFDTMRMLIATYKPVVLQM